MALTARQVMQTHVVSVAPEDPLSSVHRLFVEEDITGAPVVDDQERIVGVISATDLMRAAADEHDTARADLAYFRENLEFSGPELSDAPEDYLDRLGERRVEECMSDQIVQVTPDATIPEVARTIRSQQVHRVMVVEDDRLVGIISTFDLVGLLEKE